MIASISDVLQGAFGDGRRLESVNPSTWRERSILSNLDRLMNTRQGAISHLPDYGVPDLSDVYREMPGSIPELQQSIAHAVQVYEPRLRQVRVEYQDTDQYTMQLVFLLTALTLDGDRVRFKTTFSSEEETRVAPFQVAE